MYTMLTDIDGASELVSMRANDLSEPVDLYLQFVDSPEATNRHDCLSRAKFIREQCNGKDGNPLWKISFAVFFGVSVII